MIKLPVRSFVRGFDCRGGSGESAPLVKPCKSLSATLVTQCIKRRKINALAGNIGQQSLILHDSHVTVCPVEPRAIPFGPDGFRRWKDSPRSRIRNRPIPTVGGSVR